LKAGWDNVPMHRWAQSQLFRSFSFLLSQNEDESKQRVAEARSAVKATT